MDLQHERGLLAPDLDDDSLSHARPRIEAARQALLQGTGRGSEWLGWLHPENLASPHILDALEAAAADLRKRAETLVVVGIGGSYLGARAALEALGTTTQRQRIRFAGQTISARYHRELLHDLGDAPFALNLISKSGTTTEPAIAARLLQQRLTESVGDEAAKTLTVATTDPASGALRERADREGWTTFNIPSDVGGRFSVLTPVGLLPLAFAGIDIRALVAGATAAARRLRETPDPFENPILSYAATRHALYQRGLTVETLAVFEPRLASLAEWWKQLFGESEGKDGLGLLPTSLVMTTDLHSLGQYVQDGRRQLFETFLWIEDEEDDLTVPTADGDGDGLAYLAGRELQSVNAQAFRGTQLAHRDGGVPVQTLVLPRLGPTQLGELLFSFEAACAVSGTMLGVNPFDQPAVEGYKQKMFALLGKPGFEAEGAAARARLAAALKRG